MGATRNHTNEFLRLREHYKKRDFGRQSSGNMESGLLGRGGESWEEARHRLPPRWVEVVEGCKSDIEDIRSKRRFFCF